MNYQTVWRQQQRQQQQHGDLWGRPASHPLLRRNGGGGSGGGHGDGDGCC